MKFIFFRFSLFLIFFSYSCKNDLNLNAPYKEIPSIYALLNPQEKIQMIRINKVFLGEGDANTMAKIADSINYQAGDLIVILKHSSDPNNIVFRDSIVKTNEGVFNSTQRVYVSSQKLSTTGSYTLVVKNIKTGNLFTSSTQAMDSINPTLLGSLTPPYFPYSQFEDPINYIDYSEQSKSFQVNIPYNKDKDKGKIYQLVIRMHFNDGDNSDYFDYEFANQDLNVLKKISVYYFLSTEFKGYDLFAAAAIALRKKNINLTSPKIMYKIQYFVYASSSDYLDYLKYSSPSFNITQNTPIYSNFDKRAAIGIFTFRTRCSVSKNMSNTFISEFQRNSATCDFNFFNADKSRHGCP